MGARARQWYVVAVFALSAFLALGQGAMAASTPLEGLYESQLQANADYWGPRLNNTHIGAGVSYLFLARTDRFPSDCGTMSGTDSHLSYCKGMIFIPLNYAQAVFAGPVGASSWDGPGVASAEIAIYYGTHLTAQAVAHGAAFSAAQPYCLAGAFMSGMKFSRDQGHALIFGLIQIWGPINSYSQTQVQAIMDAFMAGMGAPMAGTPDYGTPYTLDQCMALS